MPITEEQLDAEITKAEQEQARCETLVSRMQVAALIARGKVEGLRGLKKSFAEIATKAEEETNANVNS